jgi:hypothetical protein
MAADGFTTIQRAMTVAEGEMFAELFRREGIEVHFHPMIGATIGSGEQICDLRIDVPVESEARVRELLAELEYVGTSRDDPAAAENDPEPEAPAVRPRRPMLAAGIAFLVPGGGHFHARRPWTGLLVGTTLLCGWMTSWGYAISWRGSFVGEMLFGGLIALVFVDAIAGRRAAMAENRGIRAGQLRQFARGLVMIACAAAAGAVFATAAATPRWLAARRMAQFKVDCSAIALRVSNGDDQGRLLTVSNLVLHSETSSAVPGATYRVGRDAWTQLDIRAGDAGLVELSLADELRERCIATGCDLAYVLEASRAGDASVSHLSAEGVCVPLWDQPGTVAPGRIEPAAAD